MFKNRIEAGQLLMKSLQEKGWEFDIVLGIPRGGVIVAEQVAAGFNCLMDVVMAKKIDNPLQPDNTVGAVTPDGIILLHDYIEEDSINSDIDEIRSLAIKIQADINERMSMFRSFRAAVGLEDKKVLLIDDGIATGLTIKAAVGYLKRQKAKKVYIAVPVCSKNTYQELTDEVDLMLSLLVPDKFYAVSQFYQDFNVAEDGDVIEALVNINSHKH